MSGYQPVARQFQIARQATLEATQKLIVEVAKQENAKILATDPKPQGFVCTVDGIRGAREEAVKPDGRIVYDYQRLDTVVEFALQTLQRLSPVLTGAYAQSHFVFVNGAIEDEPYRFDPGADVVISNPEPYARKIEVGSMKMTVPGTDHVYQQAQQIVQRQWQGLVDVQFGWRSLSNAGNRAKIVKRKKGRGPEHWLQSQPALIFKMAA